MTTPQRRGTTTTTTTTMLWLECLRQQQQGTTTTVPELHEVAQFYRQQDSRMPCMKANDVQYSLRVVVPTTSSSSRQQQHDKGCLVASLRMCLRYDNSDNNDRTPCWIFLRSLCVHRDMRRQGYALELVRQSVAAVACEEEGWPANDDGGASVVTTACGTNDVRGVSPPTRLPPIYLFADLSLSELYEKAGFVRVDDHRHHQSNDHTHPTSHETESATPSPLLRLPLALQHRLASLHRRYPTSRVAAFQYGNHHRQDDNSHDDDDDDNQTTEQGDFCTARQEDGHMMEEAVDGDTTTDETQTTIITTTPMNIVLLQHENEVLRKTGTGQLLFHKPPWKEEEESTAITTTRTSPFVLDSSVLTVSPLTWGGRADNAKVEGFLRNLQDQGHTVVLLWKGGQCIHDVRSCLTSTAATATKEGLSANATTTTSCYRCSFLLLDGTWQEAQSMFRKIPSLPMLPRLSLTTKQPSQYTLRGDYGWKRRFATRHNRNGDDEEEESLLCTVEVVAELLEQSGYHREGCQLRERLRIFTHLLLLGGR